MIGKPIPFSFSFSFLFFYFFIFFYFKEKRKKGLVKLDKSQHPKHSHKCMQNSIRHQVCILKSKNHPHQST